MNDAVTQNTPYQLGLFDGAHLNKQSSGVSLIPNATLRVESPWKPPNTDYEYGIIGLHKEIKDFYNYISPTVEEQTVRELVVLKVKDIIHSLWPDCQVDVFGSFSTGLYLPTSDIDMVIFGRWEALPLYTLERKLLESGLTSDLKVLDKATVPIVKMTDKETDVHLDISFNMANSVRAAELIKKYIRSYPCLPYLVLVLKQFILQRDLNEVWTGGLSSYALILMSVRFLQDSLRPNTTPEQVNLGSLLVEFFELYGRKFNYETSAIRVLGGGDFVHKDLIHQNMDPASRASILCIEDPLCPTNDVGRRSYAMLQVKRAFEHAYVVLSSSLLPHYFNQMSHQTPLSRIISISRQAIEKRQKIAEYASRLRMSLQSTMAIPVALLPSHNSGTSNDTDRSSQSSNQPPFPLSVSSSGTPLTFSDLQFLNTGVVTTASGRNGFLIATSMSNVTPETLPATFCHPVTFPTVFAPHFQFSRLPNNNNSGTHFFLIGGNYTTSSSEISPRQHVPPIAFALSPSSSPIPSVASAPQASSQSAHSRQIAQQISSPCTTPGQQPVLTAIFSHLSPNSVFPSSSSRPIAPLGFSFPSQTTFLPMQSRNAPNVYALLPISHPCSFTPHSENMPNSSNTQSVKTNDHLSTLSAPPILLHALAVPMSDLAGPPILDTSRTQLDPRKDLTPVGDYSSGKHNSDSSTSSSGSSSEDSEPVQRCPSNPRNRGKSADPKTSSFRNQNNLLAGKFLSSSKGFKSDSLQSRLRRVNSEKSLTCLPPDTLRFTNRSVSPSVFGESPSICGDVIYISSEHSDSTETSSASDRSSLCLLDADVNEKLDDNLHKGLSSRLKPGSLGPIMKSENACQQRPSRSSFPLSKHGTGSEANDTNVFQPGRRTLRRPHQSPSLSQLGSTDESADELSSRTSHDLAPALAGVDLASQRNEISKPSYGISNTSLLNEDSDSRTLELVTDESIQVIPDISISPIPSQQSFPWRYVASMGAFHSKNSPTCAQQCFSSTSGPVTANQLRPEHKRRCSRPLSPAVTISPSDEIKHWPTINKLNEKPAHLQPLRVSHRLRSDPVSANHPAPGTCQVAQPTLRRRDSRFSGHPSTIATAAHQKKAPPNFSVSHRMDESESANRHFAVKSSNHESSRHKIGGGSFHASSATSSNGIGRGLFEAPGKKHQVFRGSRRPW